MKAKIVAILLCLLVVYGGLLRFYDLGEAPYWMDEGYTINAVLSIEEKGVSVLDSGRPYSCPTYCYPTAWIAEQFGDSATSYRALAAVAGTAFIAAMFFIVRSMFGIHVALISAFFLTFSYWQIAWSRQARWYTLFALFVWLTLYCFHRTLHDEKHRYLFGVLTLAFTGLAIATHGLGYLLPFVLIGWALIERVRTAGRLNWRPVVAALATGAALFGALLAFKVRFAVALVEQFELHYVLPYYLNFYLREYWLFIFFAIAGFFMVKDGERKRNAHLLLFVFLAYLFALSFLSNIVHYRYLFHLAPALIILGTLGMCAVADALKPKVAKAAFGVAVAALFFASGMGVLVPYTHYLLESDDPETLGERPSYAYTPQPNWNAAYGYVAEHRNASDIVISSHPHFTKIFLHEAGYWIKYNYLGFAEPPTVIDDREYYVGAKVIDDLAELQEITSASHGYLVFDYMAADGRIPEEILTYMEGHFELVFTEKTNSYSEIWVYRF